MHYAAVPAAYFTSLMLLYKGIGTRGAKECFGPPLLGQVANQPKLYTHTEIHTFVREAIQPPHKSTLWGVASPVHRNSL